jgi:RND family efflux transporter MFP subunit
MKLSLTGGQGLILGLGLGAAFGIGGFYVWSTSKSSVDAKKAQAASPPVQTVTVASVQVVPVTHRLKVMGSIAARDLLPVLPQVMGLQIKQVLAEEGQTVQAGQVMAVLDSLVLKAELEQTNADLAAAQAVVRQKQAALAQDRASLGEAESNLRRYQELASQGAISTQNLESYATAATKSREQVHVAQTTILSAQADVQSQSAKVQQLQTQIAQTLVRSPARGVVAEKIARIGDVTSSGQKIFSIIRNGALELQAKVAETQLPVVKLGTPASITSDADARIQVQGKVREIAPLIDPQTRQATVKIDLPTSALLRPGMFLQASITVKVLQGLAVPTKAVLPQADGSSLVYVLGHNQQVRAQPVEVGLTLNQTERPAGIPLVEIKKGLRSGEQVVVAGAGYLSDRDRVQVVAAP